MDCQVGAISAAPMPPRKVRPISALDRSSAGLGQQHQRGADRRPSRIWRRSGTAAVEDVGQDARGDRQQEDRQGAGRLDSATAAGEAERSVTSQELATSRMKLPILPSTVAAQSTAKTALAQRREAARGRRCVSLAQSACAASSAVRSCQATSRKPPTRPEMLEEGVGRHDPLLAGGHLPEAQRDEGRHSVKPARASAPSQRSSRVRIMAEAPQLQRDHGDRERRRRRQAEVVHLGDRAAESRRSS